MNLVHAKLADLPSQIGNDAIDLFIGSTSFEDRCLSVVSHLDVASVRTSVIGHNVTYGESIGNNLTKVEDCLGDRFNRLDLSSDDPIASADAIVHTLGAVLNKTPKRILFDITTFTRESLLMILRYLNDSLTPHCSVDFIYAHAKEYSIGDPPATKWLSKGIRDIRTVLGYPGSLSPSQKTHMIVMVGFEDERALSLIRECEPSSIALGLGDASEPGTMPHQMTNTHRFDRLQSILGRVEQFEFKAYDPEATVGALASQVAKFEHCNVVIAPMNTKISTVGAALLAIGNPQIQLCYAPANIYNAPKYSIPDDDYYLFTLTNFPVR